MSNVTCSDCGAPLPDDQSAERQPCPKCGSRKRAFEAAVSESATVTDSVDAVVKRGAESWAYYYIVLAIILSFEASLIQILDLGRFSGVLTLTVVSALTIWAFLGSGWLHNKLSGIRASYENKFR